MHRLIPVTSRSTILRIVLLAVFAAPAARAQNASLTFTYSVKTMYRFGETPTTETVYNLFSGSQLGSSAYQNIGTIAPDGFTETIERLPNNSTHSTSSTNINYASVESLIAAKSGTWTLTTDSALPAETTYTFSADFGALIGDPFTLTALPSSASSTNPFLLQWSGPVNDAPMSLSVLGLMNDYSSSSFQSYSLVTGTTSQEISFNTALDQQIITLSSITTVSFADLSTPVTSEGTPFLDWSYSEKLSQGANASYLSAIPEPESFAAAFGLFALATVAFVRTRSRQRCA